MTNENNDFKDVSEEKADSKPAFPDYVGRIPLELQMPKSVDAECFNKGKELMSAVQEDNKEYMEKFVIHHAGIYTFRLGEWTHLHKAMTQTALDVVKDLEEVTTEEARIKVQMSRRDNVTVRVVPEIMSTDGDEE